MYYRDTQDFEAIKQQYNSSRVMDEYRRARIHKAEVIENLDKYMRACIEQKRVINSTIIKRFVYFNRRTEYGTSRVKYEVGVMNYPDIDNGFRYQWTEEGTGKVFSGREKKLAKEYAEQLAADYICEIRGKHYEPTRR
jgi:hypothetical protein